MPGKRMQLKEPFCGISHFVGALLSVALLVALLVMARGRPRYLVAFGIYGASLIALYGASALYHSWHADPGTTRRLQTLDYASIFLLIAGTYTPVCLITLRGHGGLTILAVEYGLALLGIGLMLFWKGAPHVIRVVLYLVMGWLAVIAWPALSAALPRPALWWLVMGGVFYTSGTVIYATDRPHLWPGKFSAHDLWHLFVMAGSACHAILVLRYIAP
jgi:hemolysin III